MAMPQEAVDMHGAALSKMCRICGTLITVKKNMSKISTYQKAVLEVYKFDINDDEKDVHPTSVCNKCRQQVKRASTSQLSGKKYEGKLPHVFQFVQHLPLSCPVCQKYRVHLNSIQTEFKDVPSTSASEASQSSVQPSGASPEPSVSSASRELFSETVPDPGMTDQGQKRVSKAKLSLKDIERPYARKRTKEAGDWISDYCTRQKEPKTDLLYFLLTEELHRSNDCRLKEVMSSWGHELSNDVSADDCLAMRILTMTSKRKYKEQLKLLKSKGVDFLKPPHVLDELERSYMPGSVRFQLEGDSDLIHHTPVKAGKTHTEYGPLSMEPSVVGSGGVHQELELPCPNFKGVEWPYAHAIAKTLEELDADIVDGLRRFGLDPHGDHVIVTTIKDGADGMGDISVMKEASDRMLPDKAFRSAFAVIKCEVVDAGVVYEPENPNSLFVTRPLLEAIADENNVASGVGMLDAMERSREVLKSKKMRVHVNGCWREHRLVFFNSMIDEKLDRAQGGLQGSGSRFLCTLCHATRETARADVGTFSISRSYEDTQDTASYIITNPDNLTQSELAQHSKGVKDFPILLSDPDHKLIDATHADINLGSFFKKLMICEVARTFSWDITRDLKPMFEDAEKRFDTHVRATVGRIPSLMMPGNYARELFDEKNTDTILGIIPNEDRRKHLSDVLALFRNLRKVYRAHHPDPADVRTYKAKAVQMADLLNTHFRYASWPNYLHKVIEHVQEVIEDPRGPGTIGALSGEGNEAANKLFRDIRRNYARKNSTLDSLRDVLWMHWLYTSPKLRRLGKVASRTYKCANCKASGHNVLTCTA